MKTLTVERRLDASPEEALQGVLRMAQSMGGRVEGDADAGTFSGLGVSGRYRIRENTLTVIVESKPFLLPWSAIEGKINAYLSELTG